MISVRGLTARAGPAVLLDGVSFEAAPGRVVALVGESGSGKTTTGLALLGAHHPDVMLSGQILVDGVDILADAAAAEAVRGRSVGFVPQDPAAALNPARQVGRVLTEVARHHAGGAMADQAVADALAAAQLGTEAALLRRHPHQLSGGQQQRMVMAQALAAGPGVLVLDEPTTCLDSVARSRLISELDQLVRGGLGLVLLCHDLGLVRALADDLVVLQRGRVCEAGRAADVLARARHPYTAELVAAEPILHRGREEPRAGAEVLTAVDITARHRRSRGRPVVLDGVSASVARGACLAVVGVSGSGKTTLARCLVGLHADYAGEVVLEGHRLAPAARRRSREQLRSVQYVAQDSRGSFDPRRPVVDAVARVAMKLGGLDAHAAMAEAMKLLARLGVDASTASRRPPQCSGGELQRAALARALVVGPEVVVCDEITSSLDVVTQASVLALLDELRRKEGMALVFISHDLAVVSRIAERVAVIDCGRIVEAGPVSAVLDAPAHRASRELVAAASAAESMVGDR